MKKIIKTLLTILVLITTSCKTKGNEMKIDERYQSEYRNQYHYSDLTSWLNDPNGFVYYKGVYHIFYQKSNGINCDVSKMSWGHATSTDLIHFKQEEDAIVYDELGSIWSGTCVVDKNNDSKLFDDDNGGLIAYYTLRDDNNIQQQAMAYSKDDGKTWIKYNNGKAIITTNDDPLKNNEFRDPKVIYSEKFGKYLMFVAGGNLRIYSSKNLIDWEIESYDTNINTECPDIFILKANDNVSKYVLSCGGRTYLIGDLKLIENKIHFVPDSYNYKAFNFGVDAYATQTFYNSERIIGAAWMSTWEYAGKCAYYYDKFNGAFSMFYEYSLVNENNEYYIYLNPINEYENLLLNDSKKEIYVNDNSIDNVYNGRTFKTSISFENKKDLIFEISLKAKDSTLLIKYDESINVLTVDRTKQKNYASKSFLNKYSTRIDKNETINIDLYVDKASLEVVINNGKNVGSFIYFPEDDVNVSINSSIETNIKAISYKFDTMWKK